ncbi:MAG: choice-of-anchor D domain-containing protein, partial [Terriglobales bacterium]
MRAAAVAAHTFPSVSARVSRILFVALIVMSASLASSAQIAVSPMSITFPTKQAQGSTSGGQIVNITNNGPNAQAVSIAASEEFSESDNCGGSIVGGGSCGMSVFFTPAMIGTVSGAVTISDNSGNLLASVGLKGTGELQLLAAPASINFGTVQIGSNSGTPKSVKITNQDTSALTITSIASSSDYIVNTSGCLNVALNPTKFCSITVQAAPTSENANGSIVVSDSLGGTPLVIPLTVNAQGGSTVPISLSPGTLTFSEGVGGTSAAQTVTVTNTSSGAVTMNSITASSQFSETNNCPSPGMTLAADTNCTVNVSFNPQFVGKITGSLAVFYNGTLSPQLASLTGTAVAGLTGPASVAFTATNEGATSVAKPVIIKNNTSNTVTLGSIVLTGDFVVQAKSTTCALSGQSLGAGSSCTVEVQFAPTVAGAIAGTFTVNNSLNPLVIPLSGTGNASPFATLSPNSAEQGTTALTVNIAGQNTNFDTTTTVNFGTGITVSNLAINGPTSASVQITISSTATVGSRTVTISTPDMSETANATFTVLTGVPSATLNPNSGQQGTGPTTIAITGFDTSFTAASKVNFGSGITTGTVKFNSATSLSVPITISSTAALGAR